MPGVGTSSLYCSGGSVRPTYGLPSAPRKGSRQNDDVTTDVVEADDPRPTAWFYGRIDTLQTPWRSQSR